MELLSAYYDNVIVGHVGITEIIKLIRRYYFWESLIKDVKSYIGSCAICQKTKARTHRPYGLLGALPAAIRSFEYISMDFITGLPLSISAADLLLARVFSEKGLPKGIVSDRGSVFISHFWREFCYHLAVKRRLSIAWQFSRRRRQGAPEQRQHGEQARGIRKRRRHQRRQSQQAREQRQSAECAQHQRWRRRRRRQHRRGRRCRPRRPRWRQKRWRQRREEPIARQRRARS
jgi:hypothetical protein